MAEPKRVLLKFERHKTAEKVSVDRLALWASHEVDAKVDPWCLPFSALRRMDTDPIVYLAERAITALIRKPDLYHVWHPLGDKALVSEAEEWLWSLFGRGLLDVLARSFVYGAVPYVLDTDDGDLIVRVPSSSATGSRKRTLPGYWRYVGVNELRPDRVQVEVDKHNALVALTDLSTGNVYDAGVARVAVWDRQFGEWTGQAARRRAWPAWAKSRIFETLQARYLERTVHTPLIIYAPGEDVRPDGATEDIPVGEFIAEQLSELVGGGYMNLPSDETSGGKRKYEAVPLELPERSDVWERALDRFDSQKLAAYLVPPAMSMIDDAIGGGAARVLRDLFSTFVEGLVGHVATELTGLVQTVHAMNHNKRTVMACEVKANEIPEKVQKLYLDVLGKVGEASRLGERVDVNALLDHMGVPRLLDSPEGGAPGGGERGPGRPRDPMGQREERREDARTPEGEEDTGGKDQEREERPA